MGYSGAEVARFPGVTASAGNRLAASEELPDSVRYVYVVLEPACPFTFTRGGMLRNHMAISSEQALTFRIFGAGNKPRA
jgi:hypothetical protein